MFGADAGSADGSGGSGGEQFSPEGAPADTHPGGSSGDATPEGQPPWPDDPCLEPCRLECVAQTHRPTILGCRTAQNPDYCGCVLPGFTQCGWLPEYRTMAELCTDAG